MKWRGGDLRRIEKLLRATSTGHQAGRRARTVVRKGFYASVRFRWKASGCGSGLAGLRQKLRKYLAAFLKKAHREMAFVQFEKRMGVSASTLLLRRCTNEDPGDFAGLQRENDAAVDRAHHDALARLAL